MKDNHLKKKIAILMKKIIYAEIWIRIDGNIDQ